MILVEVVETDPNNPDALTEQLLQIPVDDSPPHAPATIQPISVGGGDHRGHQFNTPANASSASPHFVQTYSSSDANPADALLSSSPSTHSGHFRPTQSFTNGVAIETMSPTAFINLNPCASSASGPDASSEFLDRMRTAAIMLAQLNHNSSLKPVQQQQIRERILKEMMALEEQRVKKMMKGEEERADGDGEDVKMLESKIQGLMKEDPSGELDSIFYDI